MPTAPETTIIPPTIAPITTIMMGSMQLTSLIEPIMIVVIGAIVGGMIVALYMPMFSIYENIG